MKKVLLNLLASVMPSKVILNNCIELIQREQVGIAKYGVTLEDAKLTHEQVLQHLLEEQLDAANYTRKALMVASTAQLDYALLRKEVEQLERIIGQIYAYSVDQVDVRRKAQAAVKDALFRFDAAKIRRDLAK